MSNKNFEGIIERLFVNDRKTVKGDKKSISIANNKVYYGLGLHDKETYEVGGITLKEGMTVSFEYTDGKYKNVVLETLKIVQQEVSKEVKNKFEKENMGMLRCHAFNGATSLLVSEGKQVSKDSILDAAKVIHSVTVEMKEWFGNTELGKSLDQRELGNTVGNAVINCSNFSTRSSLSLNVQDFLINTVPAMTDYILGKNDKLTVPEKREDLFEQICQAEEELKSNSTKQESKPVENKPNNLTQNSVNVAPPVYNEPPITDAWDDGIPFSPVGLQYRNILNCI